MNARAARRVHIELFKLRDEVRRLKSESMRADGSEFIDRHFSYLQDSINSLIGVLHRFDLATVWRITDQIERDAGLRQRVEARARVLDDCALSGLSSIRQRQFEIATQALVANRGGMLFWLLIPTLAACAGYQAVRGKIRDSLTVPGADLERFVPKENHSSLGLQA